MVKLFMDLSRGISGDMFISALADAGADFKFLEDIFRDADIDVQINIVTEIRNGIAGKIARISSESRQPLRTLEDILPLIDKLDISPEVRQKSIQAFYRLAEVEAEVHSTSMDNVHFHETGAVDTLVDIVGSFWGLECLNIDEATASPMPWFKGETRISHGLVSLPAPATAILMQGKQICPSEYDWEIITPTGALIVDQLVAGFEDGFTGRLAGCGLGFGSIDQGFNGLRVYIWEIEPECNYLQDKVWLMESNIDHLTGEEIGYFFQKIMEAGALDVIFLQGVMKKNRPGGQLQVLCDDISLDRVREEFFRNTLTLGLRIAKVSRNILPRKKGYSISEGRTVKSSEAVFSGKTYSRPEMESLAELAEEKGISLMEMRLKKHQP